MKLQETDFGLLSATYFKGSWECPFKEENTKLEKFHPVHSAARPVPMLSQQGEHLYFEGGNFQLAELPYSTPSMYFLLPKNAGLLRQPSLYEIHQRAVRHACRL